MFTRKGIFPVLFKVVLPVLLIFLLAAFSFEADPPDRTFSQMVDEEQILDIVRKAKEGDDASFATLYKIYYMPIFRHLYRMVGNEEDAHDLVTMTFTRAWYSLPGVKDGRHFRGWLYKIATNQAIDFIRMSQTKKRAHPFLERLKEEYSEEYSDEYRTGFEERLEEQESIKFALEQIAPKPRACLSLYEEGFSLEEIALQLGMRKKSVATYISTARRQFQEAYHRQKKSF
jgi:RNA polymerase sigma-70 factor (ECF subfamily)